MNRWIKLDHAWITAGSGWIRLDQAGSRLPGACRPLDQSWIGCRGPVDHWISRGSLDQTGPRRGSVDRVVAESPKYDLVPAPRIFRCMALRMSPRIPIQNRPLKNIFRHLYCKSAPACPTIVPGYIREGSNRRQRLLSRPECGPPVMGSCLEPLRSSTYGPPALRWVAAYRNPLWVIQSRFPTSSLRSKAAAGHVHSGQLAAVVEANPAACSCG
jgi:hypothetical protein